MVEAVSLGSWPRDLSDNGAGTLGKHFLQVALSLLGAKPPGSIRPIAWMHHSHMAHRSLPGVHWNLLRQVTCIYLRTASQCEKSMYFIFVPFYLLGLVGFLLRLTHPFVMGF